MKQNLFLSSLGIINSIGSSKKEVYDNLVNSRIKNVIKREGFVEGKEVMIGTVISNLPEIPDNMPENNIRCNRLLLAAYLQIEDDVKKAIKKYGISRVGVIIGSGTSGIDEAGQAIEHYQKYQQYPGNFDYNFLEMGTPAKFLAQYIGLDSVYYTVSTACSSSAKAFASAKNLIDLDLCDAVIVGGCDNLCKLTVGGFDSLEAISDEICNPMSKNRNGITLGEGAAVFLLTKDESKIKLMGVGESSDAHHITSPDPNGSGALSSMKIALNAAYLKPEDIDYVNMHGTATELNDQMESRAIFELFGDQTYCSSTKPFTGHTLGAAGAMEVGICWLLLSDLNKSNSLPENIFDGELDETLPKLHLVKKDSKITSKDLSICISNSFAFGGSNSSVIIGK